MCSKEKGVQKQNEFSNQSSTQDLSTIIVLQNYIISIKFISLALTFKQPQVQNMTYLSQAKGKKNKITTKRVNKHKNENNQCDV